MDSRSNCTIDRTATIYNDVMMKNSTLLNNVVVGDRSTVISSNLDSYVAINRNNYVLGSEIGHFSYTNVNTNIRHSTVGKFCSISWGVSVGGASHHMENASTYPVSLIKERLNISDVDRGDFSCRSQNNSIKRTIIGNDVWIGNGSSILGGVRVGNGAVIGAGAVVVHDVEPYSIVVGVPAKKIRLRFTREQIVLFEQIAWWDWPFDIIKDNHDYLFNSALDKEILLRLLEITNNLRGC